MLGKQQRLSRPQFRLAQKRGRSYRYPHFSLVVYRRPSSGLSSPRFSVVTSVRLAKKATTRNRLRRLIYNALASAPAAAHWDVILFPTKSMLNLKSEEVSPVVHSVLSKIPLV